MIETWNYFISGFTENRSQVTGLGSAWAKCQEMNTDPTCVARAVLPWNHNWYHEARFIQNNSSENIRPLINIFGYSWGAGFGAMQLARQLWSVGNYTINTMVLADPVFCDLRWWMRWRAVFASRVLQLRKLAPKIVVPLNVKMVHWSRQFNDWPRAHALVPDNPNLTRIAPPHVVQDGRHSTMDEGDWFQQKVKQTWAASA